MASVASEVRSDVHLLMGLPKEKHEATLAALSRKQRVTEAAAAKVATAAARLQPKEEKEEVAAPTPAPTTTTSFFDSLGFHLLLYGAGAVAGVVVWRVLRNLIWNYTGKAASMAKDATEAALTSAVDNSASFTLAPEVQRLLAAYRSGAL